LKQSSAACAAPDIDSHASAKQKIFKDTIHPSA
jgi:hypothetical protein